MSKGKVILLWRHVICTNASSVSSSTGRVGNVIRSGFIFIDRQSDSNSIQARVVTVIRSGDVVVDRQFDSLTVTVSEHEL